MTTLAIELNDAAIAVADPGGLLAVEPGCAIETDRGLEFGGAALRSSRLRPRDTNDRYWADLGTTPLGRPLASAKSAADLAHAQLLSLWQRFGETADEVLLAIPGNLDRERLGLLLGIADACAMPVTGLVDAAVAACDCPYPGWDSVHVEAQLHGFGITRIGATSRDGVDEAVVEGFEIASQTGVAQLYERWGRHIAAAFVAQTRFDPFSDGKTEQRLFDALPAWLEAFGSLSSANVEFDHGDTSKRIQLARTELIAEAADAYDFLADRVAAARRPGRGLAVRVGSVLAGLPGATARLARIPGARVVALPAGAGALGALASANDVRSKPGQVTLVESLAWRTPAGELPALRPEELVGRAAQATHLLIRATAHPIGARGLNLRVGATGQLQVVENSGDDRADLALLRSDAGLRLEHNGAARVLVNAKPAESGIQLACGDRLTVAGSTEAAQLIAVSDNGS